MVERKRSWLDGPAIPGENEDPNAPSRWPGEKLGMPQHGRGSMAPVGKRALAVLIDWFVALALAFGLRYGLGFGDVSQGATTTWNYVLWIVMGIVCGWLFARTPGMMLLGMGVARVDAEERVGLWRAVVRTLLTACFFPAVMVDSDGRGMHDRATGTTVIRTN